MPCVLLAVDGFDPMPQANTHQTSQCHFGAVIDGSEHRLAKNGMPESDEIQTSHQLTISPDFCAVCMAQTVQIFVGMDHVGHDPGACLPRSWGAGAAAYDLRKVLVKTQLEVRAQQVALEALPQGTSKPEFARRQNHAGVRAPPQHGLSGAEPRKNPLAVGLQQTCSRQILSGCEQAGRSRCGSPCLGHGWQRFVGLYPRQCRRVVVVWHLWITQYKAMSIQTDH